MHFIFIILSSFPPPRHHQGNERHPYNVRSHEAAQSKYLKMEQLSRLSLPSSIFVSSFRLSSHYRIAEHRTIHYGAHFFSPFAICTFYIFYLQISHSLLPSSHNNININSKPGVVEIFQTSNVFLYNPLYPLQHHVQHNNLGVAMLAKCLQHFAVVFNLNSLKLKYSFSVISLAEIFCRFL